MPLIMVYMWKGRTRDQKRRLVAELTSGTSSALGVKPESVTVVLQDVDKADWGLGGKLGSETEEPDRK